MHGQLTPLFHFAKYFNTLLGQNYGCANLLKFLKIAFDILQNMYLDTAACECSQSFAILCMVIHDGMNDAALGLLRPN